MSKAGGPNKGAVPLHKAMAAGEKYEQAAEQTKVPLPPPGKDTKQVPASPLDVVWAVLGQLRNEAIEAAEVPSEEHRTEFGFGRVAGSLQTIRRISELINDGIRDLQEAVEEPPKFEGAQQDGQFDDEAD